MTLSTYDELKAAVIRLDGSSAISDVIADCVALTEAEIYNGDTPMRVRDMQVRSTATLTDRFITLPEGYLEMRALHLVLPQGNIDVQFFSPESMNVDTSSGRPTQFTVTSQIELNRQPDSDYTIEMNYYKALPALSDDNQTNQILTDHPNVYLFGVLKYVNLFNAEEEKSQFYGRQFDSAVKGANRRFKKGRFGPVASMRTEGPTP